MNTEIAVKKTAGKTGKQQYGLVLALVGIIVFFSIITGGKLLSPININNIIMQNAYVVILALGMLLILVTANIDLSVGSVLAFIAGICAIVSVRFGWPLVATLALGIGIGICVGAFQGAIVAYVRVPAFIVTLAGMLTFRGLALIVMQSQTIGPLPEDFIQIGAGFFFPTFAHIGGQDLEMVSLVGGFAVSILVIISEAYRRKTDRMHHIASTPLSYSILKVAVILALINFITILLAMHNGLPNVLVIMIVMIMIYSFVTQRTIAGRHIYAVGGNADASRLSGINTKKVVFGVFVNMGVLCAIAAIVLSARNASATPKAGDGFELDAIASCFIGGTSTTGGIGTVLGVVVGAAIMGILNNGMSLMGLSVDWQRVVKGLVLLGAVVFDLYNRKKSVAA